MIKNHALREAYRKAVSSGAALYAGSWAHLPEEIEERWAQAAQKRVKALQSADLSSPATQQPRRKP